MSVYVNEAEREKQGITWAKIMEWFLFGIFLLTILFVFRYVIGFESIKGDSMNPTIEDGDMVLISKLFYSPERGDIVIAEEPNGYAVIKRVIGMPGDTVLIQQGVVYINEKPLNEPYTIGTTLDMEPINIAENHYFIVGDNRTPGESLDSRDESIGSISKENIIGESVFSIFPFGKIQ